MSMLAVHYKSKVYETNGSPLLIEQDTAYLVHFLNGKLTLKNDRQRFRFADEPAFEPISMRPSQSAIGVLMYGNADIEEKKNKVGSQYVQYFPAGPNPFTFSEKENPQVWVKGSHSSISVVNNQVYFSLGQEITLVRKSSPLEKLVLRVAQQFG